MELKDLDCPFCDAVDNWQVDGVEFVGNEVYMSAICPNCKKKIVISVPIDFDRMRMFVTPRSKNVRAEMMPPPPPPKKEIKEPEVKIEGETPPPVTAPLSED